MYWASLLLVLAVIALAWEVDIPVLAVFAVIAFAWEVDIPFISDETCLLISSISSRHKSFSDLIKEMVENDLKIIQSNKISA